MAGRGARARKVVDKQIQKEEEKQARKEYKDSFARPGKPGLQTGSQTPTPGSYPRSQPQDSSRQRKGSVLSSGNSVQSDTSDRSKSSSAVDKLTAKLSHAPAKKYVDNKGQRSAAPRGRMGGVPMKIEEVKAQREMRQLERHYENQRLNEEVLSLSPPGSAAPTAASDGTSRSWDTARVYIGNGQPPKRFPGFDKDEDLWMEDGDCLVYFQEETDEDDPAPLLRVHTKVLARARSAFIDNLLKYGEITPDDPEATPLADSASALPPRLPAWPLTSTSLGSLDQLLTTDVDGEAGLHDFPRPPTTPEIRSHQSANSRRWSNSDYDGHTAVNDTPRRGGSDRRIPSDTAEAAINLDSHHRHHPGEPLPMSSAAGEPEITHEIWFRAPSHIKRPEVQRRHHLATRNLIAVLYGLPIVGNDFYEMLTDLQNVMDTYYELNEPGDRVNTTQLLVQYLVSRKLDDVRNDLPAALGLLAWCEQPNTGWDAGWLEAFVHAVGMLTPKVLESKEQLRNLSPATRHRLSTAHSALQLKIAEAEGRLARFAFEELWYVDGISAGHPAQASFEAFREALYAFYAGEFGDWPPVAHSHRRNGSVTGRHHQSQSSTRWLSRDIVQRLQIDFGSMYDYLVDRDIAWEATEERHTRKWEMVSRHPRGMTFEPDAPGLPLTNMLVGFDSSQRFDHIPHPYPLLPAAARSASSMGGAGLQRSKDKSRDGKRSLFGGLSGVNKLTSAARKVKEEPMKVPDAKLQYQLSLAYNSATNASRLGSHVSHNRLIEAFATHEKTVALSSTCTPAEARLGRWILLYGVLQVLSSISVDTLGLKYSDGVRYFISCELDGCPPWRSDGDTSAAPRAMSQACQQRSYCWVAPTLWKEGSRSGHHGVPTQVPHDLQQMNEFRELQLSPQTSIGGLNQGVLPGLQSLTVSGLSGSSNRIAHEMPTSPTSRNHPETMFNNVITSPAPPAYSPASPSMPGNAFASPNLSGNAFAQAATRPGMVASASTSRMQAPQGLASGREERSQEDSDTQPHPLQAPHLHMSPQMAQDSFEGVESDVRARQDTMGSSRTTGSRHVGSAGISRSAFLANAGLGINRTITPTTSTDSISSSRGAKPLGHSVSVSSPHGEYELRPRPSKVLLAGRELRGLRGGTNLTTTSENDQTARQSPNPATDYDEFDALAAGAGSGRTVPTASERTMMPAKASDSRSRSARHPAKPPLRMPGQAASTVSYLPFPTSPIDSNGSLPSRGTSLR